MSFWKVLSNLKSRHQGRNPGSRRRPGWRPRIDHLEGRLCPAPYLLVTDGTLNAVFRYDGTDGTPVDQFVPTRKDMGAPDLGIVLSPDGKSFLVAGTSTHNVVRFNLADGSPDPADGQDGANFVPPNNDGVFRTEGIDFGPDGNLYVANDLTTAGQGNILQYDGTTGEFLGVFVDVGVGGLRRGNDLHWGPDGNLYVDNTAGDLGILRYDPQGKPLPSGGRDGAQFTDPVPRHSANGFAFGPDGNLYVAEINRTNENAEILQYDPDGNLLSTFVPEGTGGLGFVDGLRFGPDGNLYVATNSSVLEFSGQDGSFMGVFVGHGSGGIQLPAGLLFYDDGTSPHVSGAHGHHTQPDSALALATLISHSSDQALPILGSGAGGRHEPIRNNLTIAGSQVSRADLANHSATVLLHQSISRGEFLELSLVSLDLADLL